MRTEIQTGKKVFPRTVSFLLALLMLLGAMSTVGCGKEQVEEPSTVTDAPEETDNYQKDNLPDTLNYEGREFCTLYWNGAPFVEFEPEENATNALSQSVYERNDNVENRLNVVLTWRGIDGDNSHQTKFITYLESTIGSNLHEYDLVASYSMCAGAMAMRGYSVDLMSTDYFDYEQPWWPNELTSQAVVNNKLYFASGDISTNLLWTMYAVFYNKDLMEKLGITDNMATLVKNYQWDWDTMLSLSKDVYVDLDTIPGKSLGDQFGFGIYRVYADALFYGSGFRTVETDSATGELILSPTFGSGDVQSLIVEMLDYFETDDAWYDNGEGWSTKDYFVNDQFLFDLRPLYYAPQVIFAQDTKKEVNFGVLPVPMYYSDQGKYYTSVGFPYSIYSLPIDAKDISCSSAVLECLASEGYRKTTPVVFEQTMKLRYSEDDVVSAMFDVIRENLTFDLGRLFCSSFNKGAYSNATYYLFRTVAIAGNNPNWISIYKGEEGAMADVLDDIYTKLK